MALAALTAGEAAAALAKPWPLALLIDCVIGRNPLPDWMRRQIGDLSHASQSMALSAGLVAIHCLHAGLAAAQRALAIHMGLGGLARVRRATHSALLDLPLRRLRATPAGDFIYRATWDTCAFQTLFNQGLCAQTGAAIHVAATAWVMWRLNPPLTGVALATAPCLLVLMRWWGSALAFRAVAAQTAEAAVASQVQQCVSSLAVIQSHAAEPRESARFAEAAQTARLTRWRQHRSEVLYLAAIAILFAVGTAAVVGAGSAQALAGRLTAGELLVFVSYLAQWHEPLSQISNAGAAMSAAIAGIGRVFAILDDRPRPDGSRRPATGGDGRIPAPELRFDGVSLSYDGRRAALAGLTLRVPPGEVLALIGPSGSGKTTLLQLAARLLDPDEGSVYWDGVDFREFQSRALRAAVAFVPQEPLLLPGSVSENIAYGRPEASREQIEAAARSAYADAFIRRLPQGYDTPLGDGAASLSAGERQRISLARAFLKDAPVLLLDEPTSALDAESEALVIAGLEALTPGRTVIMAAHRLSTLAVATRIAALADGRLSEMGAPGALAAAAGYYAKLRRSQ